MIKYALCLPIYNGEPYVIRLLDALFGVLCDNITLIISDNASDDGTSVLLQEYTKNNPNIIYQRLSENVPFEDNFFNCAKISKNIGCDYISFIGHDDIPLNEYNNFYVWLNEATRGNSLSYIFINSGRYTQEEKFLGNIIDITSSEINVSPYDIANLIGLNVAFTPTLCFNVDFLLDQDQKVMGSGWWLLEVIYSQRANTSAIYSTPCSKFYEGSKANLDGKFFHMILSLLNVTDRLGTFDERIKLKLQAQILTKDVIRTVYTQKINGYKTSLKEIRLFWYFSKYSKIYAAIFIVGLIIPSFVYSYTAKLKKICR